jgi:hypothetical protein
MAAQPGAIKPCTDIEGVLEELAKVVEQCKESKSRIGYFAALYRQMTLEISRAIDSGLFDDGPRMSQFDAAFANRYFVALNAYRIAGSGPVPACWQIAYDTCDTDAAILQHLLLGINAHINLDLAGTVVDVASGARIAALRNDYLLVNQIIAKALDKIQAELDRLSPFMRVLDVLGHRFDESLMQFSVKRARDDAWDAALTLAPLDEVQRRPATALLDRKATDLAKLICRPPLPPLALRLVRLGERRDVAKVIEAIDKAAG